MSEWKLKMNLLEKQIHNKTILDAGCGTGYNSYYFSPYAKRIYAIDILQDNINTAKEKYSAENVYYIRRDVSKTGFNESFFDVVYSCDVIEHMPKPKNFIDEVYRILKPNGKLIIWTPNLKNFSGCLSKIIPHELQSKIFNRLQEEETDHYKTYLRANTIRQLDRLCKGKFRRVYLKRIDDSRYFKSNKILYNIWKLKHWMYDNCLLRWMFSSFYVEYKSMKI